MRGRRFAILAGLAVIAILAFAYFAAAAPPYDRRVSWTPPTAYTDGSPIPATDNLAYHVSVCSTATDNSTCAEIGVSALNASSWTGYSPQPTNTTRFYRVRTESKAEGTTSVYSVASEPFFLKGKEANPTGAPVVQ